MSATRKRFFGPVAIGAAFVLFPTAAYGVSVSTANMGWGDQHRSQTMSGGANVTGTLRSASSSKYVYYNGQVNLSWCTDHSVGRYSSNTNSTSNVTRGGRIAVWPVMCGVQGVQSKVCQDIANFPDACGGWSARY